MSNIEPDVTGWVKSTFSQSDGSCVEVRKNGNRVEMRDSKLGEASSILSFTPREVEALVLGVKAGEFDSYTR